MTKQRAKNRQGTSSRIILFLLALHVVGIATVASAKALPVQWLSGFKSFAAGGVGGVMSVLVGHPFDLVKVRMQTSTNSTSVQSSDKNPRTSTSTFGAFRRIVKTEGVRGLYRGVSAPILAVAPIFATSFWGFDMGDRFVRMVCHTSPGSPLSLTQLCVAGGISALPTALVMVPSERIKCIMQIQQASDDDKKPSHPPSAPRRGGGGSTSVAASGTRRYTSFMDCASDLYRQGGIPTLYKGTKLTLMRDIPGNMVYFGVYEVAKRQLTSGAGAGAANPLAPMVAGALAGILFWPVVLPTDTLKSRYQTAPEGTYKGIGQVYRDLVRREGYGGLFRGIGPAMMRSAPANAVSFMGAELTKNALAFIP